MKVILQGMRCLKKTESGEDEIYCVVTTGGANARELARFDIGNFEVGRTLHPGKLLWDGTNWPAVTITVMESDENQPGHGSDDFVGEVTVSADGKCKPGRATLDEGNDESKRYRQFSMTGSAAHYVVHLEIGN
ncbi:MAG: hypothetical protein DMG44_04775 [Acidobacteria bacterium]|nr:MAG: hypothetical protein DMG44_04775 [Acidobacteriota bacterium]